MTLTDVHPRVPAVRLGLRENVAQFSLLVVVNAFVGAMVGMERTILPLLAEQEFQLAARTAILSFIIVFGVTKAVTNYGAGRIADRIGRRHLLIAGWLVAVPVPFLLMWAPTWSWVLVANAFLGISQGLTWSTTVIMKIDLVGPARRGLAMGLNEFAGYVAVAGAALATGWVAAHEGLRPEPFYLGVVCITVGLGLSLLLVRETHSHVTLESRLRSEPDNAETPRRIFWHTTIGDPNLSSISQAGLVNNLNDGMAWGLFPLFFVAASMSLERTAALAAIYPATWGLAQLGTGALSDRIGRKWLIATGMWTQASGIGVTALSGTFSWFAVGAVLLGIGTAMVYPTLLASIGDIAAPSWRASAIGVYRFWRDLGYAIGAVIAGMTADLLGLVGALWIVAGLTFMSGLIVAFRMRETLATADFRGSKRNCNMNPRRRWSTLCVIWLLLSHSSAAWAQTADDSRDKSEKVNEILTALQAEPGKRIADVGAGEGFYSLRIARAVAPTGRVTAVDVSDKYLEKLRARLQQDNVTNVDVVVGAVDDPHLPENTFDAVLIYNAYHEMTSPEPILKAIFIALKPGGRLVMSEPLHDNLREATRAEQVKEHEIGPNFVQQELHAAGFEVIEQRADFLPFTVPGHQGGMWLMVARKPRRP